MRINVASQLGLMMDDTNLQVEFLRIMLDDTNHRITILNEHINKVNKDESEMVVDSEGELGIMFNNRQIDERIGIRFADHDVRGDGASACRITHRYL